MMGNSNNTGFSLGKEGFLPCEEMLEVESKKKNLQIAVAKESAQDENRVALAPHAVELLVNHGHKVFVEKDAGKKSNFTDLMYSEHGAILVNDKSQIYESDIVVKVAPPSKDELKLFKGRQVLISSFQVGNQTKGDVNELLKKKITAISFEYLMDKKESIFPIVQSMSEISGRTSILIAAEYLSSANNGKGEMLGGISGISPTDVVILGASTAGEFAARTALGLGANVKVFDGSVHKLRELQNRLGTRIFTSIMQPRIVAKSLKSADVVIGAISEDMGKQAFIVGQDAIMQMKPYSVIVDLQIESGGCFETSEPTSFKNPIFSKYGVVHHCVPNIPSRVARTASYALSNILGQVIIELGESGGITQIARENPGLRRGVYIYNGILTKGHIAQKFDLPFQDINLIITAF